MEEKQKVYIRGCKGRGSEVIDTLTRLGATETIDGCNNDDRIYFINHHNKITCALIDSEVGNIIMDNYKEIELPQRQWEDGDILIDDSDPKSYAVFKKYGTGLIFRAYFVLIDKTAYFDTLANVRHYHLANEEEKKVFHMQYSRLWSNMKAANTVLK